MYFFWRIQLGRRMNRLLFIDCLAVYLLGGYLEHTLFILSAIRSSTQLTTRNQSTAYFWYVRMRTLKIRKRQKLCWAFCARCRLVWITNESLKWIYVWGLSIELTRIVDIHMYEKFRFKYAQYWGFFQVQYHLAHLQLQLNMQLDTHAFLWFK